MNVKPHKRHSMIAMILIIAITCVVTISQADSSADLQTTPEPTITPQSCNANAPISEVSFSTDGQLVLANWNLGEIELWDAKSGKSMQHFRHDEARNAAISPDSNYVATSNGSETIIWDANSGEKLHIFPRSQNDAYGRTDTIFTEDNQYIVTSGFDGATLWEINSGKKLHDFPADDSRWDAQLSPDGKNILTSGSEGVILWDVSGGQKIHSFPDAGSDLFSPDGKWIVTNGRDGLVVWRFDTLKQTLTLDPNVDDRYLYYFSSDSRYLLSRDSNFKQLTLWDIQTGATIDYFDAKQIQVFKFLPHENKILIIENLKDQGAGTRLQVWDLPGKMMIVDTAISLDPDKVTDYDISPDGQYLLSGSIEGKVQLWGIQQGEEIREFCG